MTPEELKQARQMLGLSQRGKGLTQVELGHLIGLSSNSVSRAERGDYAITEQTAQAVRLLKWIQSPPCAGFAVSRAVFRRCARQRSRLSRGALSRIQRCSRNAG